ncbi:hypothetical protein EON83_05265 [bacterium]|nr:MAG: hypothetical protein EON83_05265 [bacterium]
MSDYPDWQADNEQMRAALARLHHLHRTTGQVVPEAKEQFFAALQDAYILIPHQGPNEENDLGSDSQIFSFYFEPIENGLLLSVFSTAEEARAFRGENEELHHIVQSAPDFFGSIMGMAEALDANGDVFVGVVLDRASENSYFFDIPELVSLSAGGRVLGPSQKVSIESGQMHIGPLPQQSPLTPQLSEAIRGVMNEAVPLGVRELWAFWLTIDGKYQHLGMAVVAERPDVIGHIGPLFEEQWHQFGPKYEAFDLMFMGGPQEAGIRSHGTLLWRVEPPKKRALWPFSKSN